MNNLINLYELLGLPHNASEDEIKKAFREKAHKYHPDVNSDPAASELFQSYHTAYQILTDPTKRGVYNLLLRQKLSKKSSQARATRTYEKMHRYARYRAAKASATRYNSTEYTEEGYHGWFLQIIYTLAMSAISIIAIAVGLFCMFLLEYNGHLLTSYVLLFVGTLAMNAAFDAVMAMYYALKGSSANQVE